MIKSYFSLDMILEDCAHLKKPTTDILPDFAFILEYQLGRFKDFLPDNLLDKLTAKLKATKKYKSKPHSKNRLYLITDIDIPELILFDVEECLLDNLMYSCDILKIPDSFSVHPSFTNTLFIFSADRNQPYAVDIYTKTFAEILRCFHSQDSLSNSEVRESWRNRPRRANKSHD